MVELGSTTKRLSLLDQVRELVIPYQEQLTVYRWVKQYRATQQKDAESIFVKVRRIAEELLLRANRNEVRYGGLRIQLGFWDTILNFTAPVV